MENNSESAAKQENPMELNLPSGFRFHPTDEELIAHYLMKKVLDTNFTTIAVGVVDMNKVEPWELPRKAKLGENEWYFFCVRDKKYPNGQRTNRATPSGYWKATGKDKAIFDWISKALVGMKKTLVFYKGRAPTGEKTNWVCHEYRLEGGNVPKCDKEDWVISRVFQKATGGNNVDMYGLKITTQSSDPPLMGASLSQEHVPCYSTTNNVPEKIIQDALIINNNDGNNDKAVFGSTNPIPLQDPPSPLTQQFNSLPDIIEGFDDQFIASLSANKTPFGNYGEYDYNQALMMDEGQDMFGVRTDNSSVVSDPELGKKRLFGEEGGVDNLYGFWDFDKISEN